MTELANARRTIDKAEDALRYASQYFEHQAEMNASAHLSTRVMHSPLYALIESVLSGIEAFHASYPE